MDSRLRTWLIGFVFAVLAVWVGISLANEERLLAMLTVGVCAGALFAWIRGPHAEAWLLGLLVFGYVIGSRGFAQLLPLPGLPLFFGELGLGFSAALVLLRGALSRRLPVQRDVLNVLLLIWFALGAGRIGRDVRAYGFVALRDFAMVYYTLYFFVSQHLAAHAPSRNLLQNALLASFGVLPIAGFLSEAFPDFFRSNLLVAKVPLIIYKGDLLATFLFTGFVVLLPGGAGRWQAVWWRWLTAVGSLVLGLTLLSRSSMIGLGTAVAWLAWSGRWRHARVLLAVSAAGLLAVTAFSLIQRKDFTQTKAYAIYEAVASIADYSGTRVYRSEMSNAKGDNNRFRLVWWKNVAEETLTTSPVLGLGFGADLAHGFLLEYYPTGETDFTARSPHNIFITTLGRMGLAGAAVLLAIYLTQVRITARTARAARKMPALDAAIALQAAVWVVLGSACFGVVLEGPMGAVPFWILLGLAHHEARPAAVPAGGPEEVSSIK